MLLDSNDINDGLIEVQGEDASKPTNPLDRAAIMKAMACAKGKNWAEQPTDSGDVYYGAGDGQISPSKKDWEVITSDDLGAIMGLGIKL